MLQKCNAEDHSISWKIKKKKRGKGVTEESSWQRTGAVSSALAQRQTQEKLAH